MRIKLSLAASTLALGLALAGTASAQDYGRIVTFGDSLSDNGNLYAVSGNPVSPPYYMGRFSNGPVWVELLGWTQSSFMGPFTGSYNGAFGGARTDSSASPPGMRVQVNNYIGGGGTFRSTDLVTLWGGANNIFQGMPAASVALDPFGTIAATSVSAAADMGFLVNQVTTAGAGTVLVANLPNLGTTPQFGGTTAQGLATHATNAFNTALFAQLRTQAAAHPTSNIIFMDVNRAFSVLLQSPGRFGFSNAANSCFNGLAVCATPDTYVFWDGVHPTAAGHALIASLATDYLYYLDRGAYSALEAEIGVRGRSDGLDNVMGRLGYGPTDAVPGGLYVGLSYDQTDLDARGVIPDGDMTGGTLIVGADGQLTPGLRVGGAMQMRSGGVSVDNVNFDADGMSLDAYMGFRQGAFFVNAAVGYSWDQYNNIARVTATPGVIAQSETTGSSWGAKAEAGFVHDMGSLAFIPRVGVSWISTGVDGYVETNDFGAQHQVRARNIDIVSAEAVLRVEGDMGSMNFWGEGGYRDVLSHDGDPVVIGLAGNTALPLALDAGDPDGGQALVGLGLSTHIGIAEVGVGYRGRFGEAYTTHSGGIEVTVRF